MEEGNDIPLLETNDNVSYTGVDDEHGREYATGFGGVTKWNIDDFHDDEMKDTKQPVLLNTRLTTAMVSLSICGHALFTNGLMFDVAGVYAPFSSLLVVLLMYCMKQIYSNILLVLPMNGGAFNVLINTTSKKLAAIVGCLSLIACVTAGTFSVCIGVEYLLVFKSGILQGLLVPFLLVFVCLLALLDVIDGARICLFIFAMHAITLCILMFSSLIFVFSDGFSVLSSNWENYNVSENDWFTSTLCGFGFGILIIVGMDQGAQFVEEQKPNAYFRSLKYIFPFVAILQPLFSFFATAIVPYDTLAFDITVRNTLIAEMARITLGNEFQYFVCVDAFLVMIGTTFVCYLAASGTFRRLASDQCLPRFIITRDNHGIYTYSMLVYFICSLSVYAMVQGSLAKMSVVYSVCYAMLFFSLWIGNVLIQTKRAGLNRLVKTRKIILGLGFCLIVLSFVSILFQNSSVLSYFLIYFILALLCVAVCMYVNAALRITQAVLKYILTPCTGMIKYHILSYISNRVEKADQRQVLFFIKKDIVSVLNKAILYIRDNEDITWIKIVHVYENEVGVPPELEEHLRLLSQAYPSFRIDLVLIKGIFEFSLLETLSVRMKVPKNNMFIACPNDSLEHTVVTLGGVRVITH